MRLRVARHTERLDEVVAFYRDGIGLTEIGRFRDHDGYDGVFLAVRPREPSCGGVRVVTAAPYAPIACCVDDSPGSDRALMRPGVCAGSARAV